MLVRRNMYTLRDHVNFSLACRTLMDLYDDKFWKFACMAAGWTMLESSDEIKSRPADLSEPQNSLCNWATLARVVVHDAKVFNDTEEESIRGLTASDGEYGFSRKDRRLIRRPIVIFEADKPTFPIPAIKTKREVKHDSIALKGPKWRPAWSYPWADQKGFFTVRHLQAECKSVMAADLLAHPYLANRFFTSPPVEEVLISCGKLKEHTIVRNTNGVTVHDVYLATIRQ